jgi:CubicO group peptidase (beta-lactamase class C family)
MKKILSILLLGMCLWSNAQVKNYYPAAGAWEKKSPSVFKIDSSILGQAIQFAKDNETKFPKNLWLTQAMQFGKEPFSDPVGPMANRGPAAGLIVYKGYIIAQWGDPSSVEMVNSVTKSMLSTVVGLAVDKGLIKSIDDKVYSYLPPIEVLKNGETVDQNPIAQSSFIYPFETAHNRTISWNHMLRQTSDWEGVLWGKPDWADRPSDKADEWTTRKRNEPGSTYKYNDTRVNALALAATTIWRKPLPEVLREQIMNPIGASNTWAWTGYKNAWIVLDGKQIQSVSGGGHFGGGMFMNAYDMARFGLLTLRKGNWNGKQLISEDWIRKATTPTSANTGYGFMNYFLNTQRKMYPSAPEKAYAHIGNGTNAIYVDPENDIVAVVRWIDDKQMDGFIKILLSALPSK